MPAGWKGALTDRQAREGLARRQSLPLHRLRPDRRCRAGSRRGAPPDEAAHRADGEAARSARRRRDAASRASTGSRSSRRARPTSWRKSTLRIRMRCWSPARPMSGSGSPSSTGGSTTLIDLTSRERPCRRRGGRRRADDRRDGQPSRRDGGARAPASRSRRADAPLRLHPDPQRRDGRRQHRQRLADRRPAAGADRARCAADAAARRRSGGKSRWRISSSPMASRTARRASSSNWSSCRASRRTCASPATSSRSASTRTFPRVMGAFRVTARSAAR